MGVLENGSQRKWSACSINSISSTCDCLGILYFSVFMEKFLKRHSREQYNLSHMYRILKIDILIVELGKLTGVLSAAE